MPIQVRHDYTVELSVENAVPENGPSFTAVALAVVLRANPVQAAIVYAGVNGCGTIVIWILLRRSLPWVHLGWRHARWPVIRKLASPAVSFLGFPIGNAINIQGILFVVLLVSETFYGRFRIFQVKSTGDRT